MAVVYLTMGTKVETTSATKLSTYHTTTSHTPIRFVKEWMQSKEFFSLRIIPWPLNCSPRSFHLKKQEEWEAFIQNLPKAGFTTEHVCQALPNLGSGDQTEALWLTPTVTAIGTRSDESLAKRTEYRESIGRSSVPPGCLAEQVSISGDTPIQNMRKTWPTPNSSHLGQSLEAWKKREAKYAQEEWFRGMHLPLDVAVQMEVEKQTWPTPNVSDGYNANLKDGHDIKRGYLRGVVHLWPTPSAQLAGEGELLDKLLTKDGLPALPNERAYNPNTGKKFHITLNRAVKMWPEEERPQGQLNPDWVEWLMGFPALWSIADPKFI